MVGDFLVGQIQRLAALQGALLQQELGQPLVEPLPHDLLHQPHDLGKPAGHDLVGIVGQRGRLGHQSLKPVRRHQEKLGVLFRLNGDIELDAPHHARGREQTDVPGEQPVNGDFPALGREQAGPELAGLHQQQAQTVVAAPVEHGAGLGLPPHRDLGQGLPLGLGQLIPHGEKCRQFHLSTSKRIAYFLSIQYNIDCAGNQR